MAAYAAGGRLSLSELIIRVCGDVDLIERRGSPRVNMERVFKTLVAVVALMTASAGALRAGEPSETCRRDGGIDRPDAAAASAKPRLFERSADPASERSGIVKAVGLLAVKASSAPLKFTRWLRTRTAQLRTAGRSE